ncbi:DUF6436 domain-containing protein [Paraglaciecola aquimarina]|uniref:DUF6436 domain-containing protein n=1 Tax=Paraglaciecola aquimarina TaxID=1235557 RepID=A0ABU3SRZ9_9ALTE|nr:DUF6436 domain-containing protein [Paraglaciecola aquimarina]MDU0352758.1 DUF6436 domain-containing protein [Paraglaciecola aquimarina]
MTALSVNKLAEFDPQLKLSAAISDLHFEAKLKALLQAQYKVTAKRTFHFSENNCFCQYVAAKHIANLERNLANLDFNNIHINLSEHPALSDYIPSTPALVIFGQDNELIFLGPYAEGLGCISGTGLVDKVVENLNSPEQENSLFITETKGCYCAT